jgi:hypothetical protein
MAMRLMLVISYLHSDACKLPNLQPSSKTVRSANHQFACHKEKQPLIPFQTLKQGGKVHRVPGNLELNVDTFIFSQGCLQVV